MTKEIILSAIIRERPLMDDEEVEMPGFVRFDEDTFAIGVLDGTTLTIDRYVLNELLRRERKGEQ